MSAKGVSLIPKGSGPKVFHGGFIPRSLLFPTLWSTIPRVFPPCCTPNLDQLPTGLINYSKIFTHYKYSYESLLELTDTGMDVVTTYPAQ